MNEKVERTHIKKNEIKSDKEKRQYPIKPKKNVKKHIREKGI